MGAEARDVGAEVAAAGKELEEQRTQGRQLQAALDSLRSEHKGFDARFAAAQAAVRREEDNAAKQRVRSAVAEQAHRSAQLQMRAREEELLAHAQKGRFTLSEKRKELRAAEADLGEGGGAISAESAGPSSSEVAWGRVVAGSEGAISTPAELLRRALSHREMRRELEMAISRAAAALQQLRTERDRLERQSRALEAASEARGGVRASASNDLKAAEKEAAARLAMVAAPRADAEARLREARVLLRRVVGSAAEAAAPRRGLAAPPPCHGVLQVSECDAASDAELPLVLQAAREAQAATTARGHAAWGGNAPPPSASHGPPFVITPAKDHSFPPPPPLSAAARSAAALSAGALSALRASIAQRRSLRRPASQGGSGAASARAGSAAAAGGVRTSGGLSARGGHSGKESRGSLLGAIMPPPAAKGAPNTLGYRTFEQERAGRGAASPRDASPGHAERGQYGS